MQLTRVFHLRSCLGIIGGVSGAPASVSDVNSEQGPVSGDQLDLSDPPNRVPDPEQVFLALVDYDRHDPEPTITSELDFPGRSVEPTAPTVLPPTKPVNLISVASRRDERTKKPFVSSTKSVDLAPVVAVEPVISSIVPSATNGVSEPVADELGGDGGEIGDSVTVLAGTAVDSTPEDPAEEQRFGTLGPIARARGNEVSEGHSSIPSAIPQPAFRSLAAVSSEETELDRQLKASGAQIGLQDSAVVITLPPSKVSVVPS